MLYKYEIFWLKCNICSDSWEKVASCRSDDRFVFTSRQTYEPRILMFNDEYFNEILKLVDHILRNSTLDSTDKAGIFHEMLGLLSDKASDGTHFSMMTDYICPKCRSTYVGYGPKDPPAFKDLELPTLEHTEWDILSQDNKIEKLTYLIESVKWKYWKYAPKKRSLLYWIYHKLFHR